MSNSQWRCPFCRGPSTPNASPAGGKKWYGCRPCNIENRDLDEAEAKRRDDPTPLLVRNGGNHVEVFPCGCGFCGHSWLVPVLDDEWIPAACPSCRVVFAGVEIPDDSVPAAGPHPSDFIMDTMALDWVAGRPKEPGEYLCRWRRESDIWVVQLTAEDLADTDELSNNWFGYREFARMGDLRPPRSESPHPPPATTGESNGRIRDADS